MDLIYAWISGNVTVCLYLISGMPGANSASIAAPDELLAKRRPA
jgi:hypothetical protein